LTRPIFRLLTFTLNCSYTASSDTVAIGPESSLDYTLDKPSSLMQRSWISYCVRLAFDWHFPSAEIMSRGTAVGIPARSMLESKKEDNAGVGMKSVKRIKLW